MKKDRAKPTSTDAAERDEILPEYDFSQGRPNPYAERYRAGTNVVVLDPDVAAVFTNPAEVNEVLRSVAGIIRKHKPPKPRSRRSA
jgi:hypothetical protein